MLLALSFLQKVGLIAIQYVEATQHGSQKSLVVLLVVLLLRRQRPCSVQVLLCRSVTFSSSGVGAAAVDGVKRCYGFKPRHSPNLRVRVFFVGISRAGIRIQADVGAVSLNRRGRLDRG